ncbi:MAG: OmpA family protein, partial [Steroidobacteraceae bacterium]
VGVTEPAELAAKVVTFPEAALFEFGKAELKPEGKLRLAEYREQAKDELSRADHVKIIGYTDNAGKPEYNSTLSQQRAEAVRDNLVSLGADASKIEVSGAGETNPVADNSTKEGRAQNRRVEVAVLGVEK